MSETDVAAFPVPEPVDAIPDHTKSADDVPPLSDAGEERQKFKLGENKKRGSGVRRLNKKDLEQLKSYYDTLSFVLMPFNRKAAETCAEGSQNCVDAWAELAESNDGVRKMLLSLIEGGAWGRVVMAHIPLAWAFVPEHVQERLPALMGIRHAGDDQEPSPNGAQEAPNSWFTDQASNRVG